MSSLIPTVAAIAALMAPQLGGMDMAVAQKWSAAKVVHYRIVGVHDGREMVVFGDYEGKADVLDRVTVELDWDARKRKVIGAVKLTDAASELKNVKSDGTNCPPPQLDGAYEHFQSLSHSMTTNDQIVIKGTRTYPAAKVSNYPASCSMRSIPGGKEETILGVAVVAPDVLGMPITKDGPVVVAADRKTFSVKAGGSWVWTYTPTLSQ